MTLRCKLNDLIDPRPPFVVAVTLQDEKFELPRDVLDNFTSVRNLIEQIRLLEKSFDEVPHRNEELLEEMVDWGIRFGCYVKSIAMKKIDGDENYGVFCTSRLQVSWKHQICSWLAFSPVHSTCFVSSRSV